MEKMVQKLYSLKKWKNKKKLQYLISEYKLGKEASTDYTQIDSPRPKLKLITPRPPEPRLEEELL